MQSISHKLSRYLTSIVIVVIISCQPGIAAEASDYIYETSEDNTITITGYSGPGGDLVIPAEIEGKPVTAIGRLAFQGQETITSVRFPETLVSIDRLAFNSNTQLTDVYIPASVTHMARPVFNRCTNLQNIHVAEGNPSFRSIDGVLFSTYQGTEIDTIRHYPAARQGPYVIPDFVTRIHDGAFIWARGLTAITIPEGVTWIGKGAFHTCESLTEIALPESLTTFSSAARQFKDCINLERITIPDGVKAIPRRAFEGCVSLKEVILSNNLEVIEANAFENCTSLTEIIIPASVTRIGGRRGGRVFAGCENLTKIYFLGDAPEDTAMDNFPAGVTIYHTAGASGWPQVGEPFEWNGRPTREFHPDDLQAQRDDSNDQQ
ncbi:MAG: leucine-rich repeat domain-containing protein [Planctomycetota bacterium]|nr:MAG: leucine-rich repeat domain-containing protein [Planctomycetota bacterium]